MTGLEISRITLLEDRRRKNERLFIKERFKHLFISRSLSHNLYFKIFFHPKKDYTMQY